MTKSWLLAASLAQRDRDIPTTLVAVTDGENAYSGWARLGDLRVKEQTSAAAHLGIEGKDVIRSRIADSGVREEQARLAEHLTPLVSPDTHILAPWPHDSIPIMKLVAMPLSRLLNCQVPDSRSTFSGPGIAGRQRC